MTKFGDISFSFDDGPYGGNDSLTDIVFFLKENDVYNFHFFINGYHFLKEDFLKKINTIYDKKYPSIAFSEEVPRLKMWQEVLNMHNLSEYLNKSTADKFLANFKKANIIASDRLGYHGMFHPPYSHPSHHQFLPVSVLLDDINTFEHILSLVLEHKVRIKIGRPPGGGGFDLHSDRRKNYRNMLEAARIRGDFRWVLWKSSSKDWKGKGVNTKNIIRNVKQKINRNPEWEMKSHDILFHSLYFDKNKMQIKNLIDRLKEITK